MNHWRWKERRATISLAKKRRKKEKILAAVMAVVVVLGFLSLIPLFKAMGYGSEDDNWDMDYVCVNGVCDSYDRVHEVAVIHQGIARIVY